MPCTIGEYASGLRQSDWPLPIGPQYPVSLRSFGLNIVLLFPPVPPPTPHGHYFFADVGRLMSR